MEHFDWFMGAVLPYINFGIFIFLLVKFGRTPIVNATRKRHDDYVSLFSEAKRVREEAEEQSKQLQDRLKNFDQELEEMRETAKVNARREADAMIENANTIANNIRNEAKRIADAEVEAARAQLQQDVVAAVRNQVAERMEQQLSEKDHVALIDRDIGRLSQIKFEGELT